MLLDIVILPPVDLRQKIGKKIKKEMGDYQNLFVVDDSRLIPHLSLWHLKTGMAKLGELYQQLQKIAEDKTPIKIHSSGFDILKMRVGVVVSFSVHNSKALAFLQKEVFENVHQFKTGIMPLFKLSAVWTEADLKQVKKYGRPLRFKPHFTMGWLKNKEEAMSVKRAMQKVKFKFLAKEIYVCRVNRFWQVDKIIRKISF